MKSIRKNKMKDSAVLRQIRQAMLEANDSQYYLLLALKQYREEQANSMPYKKPEEYAKALEERQKQQEEEVLSKEAEQAERRQEVMEKLQRLVDAAAKEVERETQEATSSNSAQYLSKKVIPVGHILKEHPLYKRDLQALLYKMSQEVEPNEKIYYNANHEQLIVMPPLKKRISLHERMKRAKRVEA